MSNAALAEHLNQIAKLTDIQETKAGKGGPKFRVKAFEKAANAVREATEEVTAANVAKLPGIGKSTKEVALDFLETGTSKRLHKLDEAMPGTIEAMTMTRVKGIGPVTAMVLKDKGLPNLDALVKAVESGALDKNPKLAKFKTAILIARDLKDGRVEYDLAKGIADYVRGEVEQFPGVLDLEVCGSLRRKKAMVKDADIVVKAEAKDHPAIHEAFGKLGETFVSGAVKTTIYVEKFGTTFQCDLWTVEPWHFGGAVAYATGSKEHNIELRKMARSRRMRIDEKGIFQFTVDIRDEKGLEPREDGLWQRGERVADRLGGEKESDLYDVLGIPYVEPEDR